MNNRIDELNILDSKIDELNKELENSNYKIKRLNTLNDITTETNNVLGAILLSMFVGYVLYYNY